MTRLMLSVSLALSVITSAIPAQADSYEAVVGSGVRCSFPSSCVPHYWFIIEAREPGEGTVQTATRDGEVQIVSLYCVSIETEVEDGSKADLLYGAGLDAAGKRWYVRARQGEQGRAFLTLSQRDELGTGPCGIHEGLSLRQGLGVVRLVFIRA